MFFLTEVKLKSDAKGVLVVYGIASLPQRPPVISWCRLIPEGKTPPEDHHMVIHKLCESRGQTVESVVQKYSKQVNLRAILIIANLEQRKLNTAVTKDFSQFAIVIIPKTCKPEISHYLESEDDSLQATIGPLYSKRSEGSATGRLYFLLIYLYILFSIYIIYLSCTSFKFRCNSKSPEIFIQYHLLSIQSFIINQYNDIFCLCH